MYPSRELIGLATRKETLLGEIALRRARCAEAAARVAQPLEWLDRAMAFWRRFSPLARFAAIPLGLLLRRMIFPRPGKKIRSPLVGWGSLAFVVVRGIIAATATARGSPKKEPPVRARLR
ncbi:hypothetical protein OpiT1DRAFT_05363 [Opitutaceae bacterium TAV1]|nr:hypothetical protein OpiT1DRAFT_05363 [Opitutaceae bacterium TAV1]